MPKKNIWKIGISVEIPEGKGYQYLYHHVYKSFLELMKKHHDWKIKKLKIVE